MERNVACQQVKENVIAARARGRKWCRPRLMTSPGHLLYAQHPMMDWDSGALPPICRELGGVPASTLCYYLHTDGVLETPGLKPLRSEATP